MAQKQKCCVSDMGHMIPQIRSTTTTKTKLTDPNLGFVISDMGHMIPQIGVQPKLKLN